MADAPSKLAGHAADDPLARLHKMSATAGVAISPYVAINAASIAALLLAIAGVLGLFVPILMVIAFAGLIVAPVALIQVRRSNGTQSGRLLAYLGLGFCTAIIGISTVRWAMHTMQSRQQTQAMVAVIADLDRDIRAGRYDLAYQLFSADFRQRISFRSFTNQWQGIQHPKGYYGTIKSLRWNGVNANARNTGPGEPPAADIEIAIESQFAADLRWELHMRLENGQWRIFGIPFLFPE